jgi:hypothetical protein
MTLIVRKIVYVILFPYETCDPAPSTLDAYPAFFVFILDYIITTVRTLHDV